jgi:regulator of protease activity HflC (stomatin/prohibitin superfamily)
VTTLFEKPLVLTVSVVLLVAGLVTLYSAAFIVDQAEQVIIVEFGEPKGELIASPGLYWKKPFIQVVRRFDKRLLVSYTRSRVHQRRHNGSLAHCRPAALPQERAG